MALHDVTTQFARAMKAENLDGLDSDKLIAFRIFDVTSAFIDELRATGLPATEANKLIAFRVHGVTPAVVRDLALVVSQTVPAEALSSVLREAAPAIVREIDLFDVYQGHGVDPQKKSLAFRVVMQDTHKTLSDGEVEMALAKLKEAAEREFAAKLRA